MSQGLSISTQGMRTCQQGMALGAANIANAQTLGFKSNKSLFLSQVIDPYNTGVSCTKLTKFEDGKLMHTSNKLDLTTTKRKFFVVRSQKNENGYKNTGSFHVGNDGYILDENNNFLLGIKADEQINFANLQPVQINRNEYLEHEPTQNIFIEGVLSNKEENLFNIQIVTQEGDRKNGYLSIERDQDNFIARVFIDNVVVDETILYPQADNLINDFEFANSGVKVNFSNKENNLQNEFNAFAKSDGKISSSISNFHIDEEGNLFQMTEEGEKILKYVIPTASFHSTHNLELTSENFFKEKTNLQENVFLKQEEVQSGFLMDSNVDLGDEISNLIEMQMAYVHNIQAFKTQLEAEKQLLNLI